MKVVKLSKEIKVMASMIRDGGGTTFRNLMVAALESSGAYTETNSTSGKIGFKRRSR